MLEKLKEEVYKANLLLQQFKLVIFTWGNVSAIDMETGYMVIKPSGVEYEKLTPDDMVVVDTGTGNIVEGTLKPSSDTPTHIELYKSFKDIGGIVHTHSRIATSFAQSGKGIIPLGTTHADYFYGEIPCTRALTADEINGEYEVETGKVIIETFKDIDPLSVPGVLVRNHGPFTWGSDAFSAVHNALVLEEVAAINLNTMLINSNTPQISKALSDKHFKRKHGINAYYGQ